MQFLGIELEMRNTPALDKQFVPLALFFKAYQKLATEPFAVAIERTHGLVNVFETRVICQQMYEQADRYYLDRLVKFLLWSRGGYKIILCGDARLGNFIQEAYTDTGTRSFDKKFMERVYKEPFEVILCPYEDRPAPHESSVQIGRHLSGCRIGFDAGGSDRKVSAVKDGIPLYSEEVVWHPKTNADPAYHFKGIMESLKTAAAKLPRVDAIGISSAGIYIDNQCRVASLFLQVSDEDFEEKVQNIYIRAARKIGGNIPLVVANDGDVTALAGAMGLEDTGVLGIAMGTSEAAGYVDLNGNITGWLNELAFAPVDGQPGAMEDEWSGDIGCGVKYFSQDAIIKLAPQAGIELRGKTPAEKLKEVQKLMRREDERAAKIYRSVGIYLGHTLGLYALFYKIKHVLMLGRVMSGKGGDILLEEAKRVMREEYPDLNFVPLAPEEKVRRVGQSVAAASLPEERP